MPPIRDTSGFGPGKDIKWGIESWLYLFYLYSTQELHSGRDFQRFDGGYVQRLRGGDTETERHFISYFKDLLRIKLRSRLRLPQLVEDTCQETFRRVFKTLRSGEEIQHPERLGACVNTVRF